MSSFSERVKGAVRHGIRRKYARAPCLFKLESQIDSASQHMLEALRIIRQMTASQQKKLQIVMPLELRLKEKHETMKEAKSKKYSSRKEREREDFQAWFEG